MHPHDQLKPVNGSFATNFENKQRIKINHGLFVSPRIFFKSRFYSIECCVDIGGFAIGLSLISTFFSFPSMTLRFNNIFRGNWVQENQNLDILQFCNNI